MEPDTTFTISLDDLWEGTRTADWLRLMSVQGVACRHELWTQMTTDQQVPLLYVIVVEGGTYQGISRYNAEQHEWSAWTLVWPSDGDVDRRMTYVATMESAHRYVLSQALAEVRGEMV